MSVGGKINKSNKQNQKSKNKFLYNQLKKMSRDKLIEILMFQKMKALQANSKPKTSTQKNNKKDDSQDSLKPSKKNISKKDDFKYLNFNLVQNAQIKKQNNDLFKSSLQKMFEPVESTKSKIFTNIISYSNMINPFSTINKENLKSREKAPCFNSKIFKMNSFS
jgi:hypothetical protein